MLNYNRAFNSSLQKREGDWVELTFAKTSRTVPCSRRENWPIAEWRVTAKDLKNNWGAHARLQFLSSFLSGKTNVHCFGTVTFVYIGMKKNRAEIQNP